MSTLRFLKTDSTRIRVQSNKELRINSGLFWPNWTFPKQNKWIFESRV